MCSALTMVHYSMNTIFDGVASRPKMQNGSSKTAHGIIVNGMVSTAQRQSQPKFNRQDRGSSSSSASCPVFSAWQCDPEEDPAPRCPSSLSSPTLHGSLTDRHEPGSTPSYKGSQTSLKGSVLSLQNSRPSLEGSASTIKGIPTSALQSTKLSLCGSASSLHSSSTIFRSSSSSQQSGNSSEDDSWDTDSWSSGATCLLRSSIKQHSEEVFRVRASSGSRPKRESDSETGYQNVEGFPHNERKSENQKISEKAPMERNDSLQSETSSRCSSVTSGKSAYIEEKIEAKLKFSKFLDEVTCRVLDPDSLQAFGVLLQKEEPVPNPQSPLVNRSYSSPLSCQQSTHTSHRLRLNWDPPPTSFESRKINISTPMNQWKRHIPSCRVLDSTETQMRTPKETHVMEQPRRTYLETDKDSIQQDDCNSRARNVKKQQSTEDIERRNWSVCSKPSQTKCSGKKCSSVVSDFSDSLLGTHYPSTLLPGTVSNSNLASTGTTHAISILQEQKEDLRKQLSYTTHKLEMLKSEFNSTRQYLETELRRAQEELEKFTDKLRRIQSSYGALQRINQELEDKIHRMTQQHEEEKRKLSREIIILNNHLMEAKITIEKLREDNDMYRKDCNLAAQLLHCEKSHYRAHKPSKLPIDFEDRLSSHIEKKGIRRSMGLCHSAYPDAVPTTINAKILTKPEPGSSCPVTRSPSPQPQDPNLLANNGTNSGDTLQRRVGYKSSDLYCSDTALYCPTDERRRSRWQERRQSADLHGKATSLVQAHNSTESNPEEEIFHPSFAHSETLLHEFAAGSTRASSSYSSFSVASDEKGFAPSSTLSSSHLALYMDWQEGDYEQKSISSYEKDSPRFPKSHSYQQMSSGMHNDTSSVYSRTASSYSEPYNTPGLTSSHSMGSSGVPRESITSIHIPEEDMTGHWRKLSMEDINAFSYRNPGRVSPYSFSEQHFAMGPANIKLGPLYSSFHEGDDMLHIGILDPCLSTSPCSSLTPSPKDSMGASKACKSKNNSQDPRTSFFLAGSTKDNKSTVGKMISEYVNISPKSSAESLNQNPLEVSNVEHYQLQSPGPHRKTSPQHQKIGSTGLSRKDSLTKAQLYGTLLN